MSLTPVGDPEVDAELRRRVEASKLAEVPPPPPPLSTPEVRWRPATAEELSSCSSANGLKKRAEAAGWTVHAHYARGPFIGAKGDELDIADGMTLIFSFERGRPEAWATWYRRGDGKWKVSTCWLVPISKVSTVELGLWLTGAEPKERAA